jgi:hypothetical protein
LEDEMQDFGCFCVIGLFMLLLAVPAMITHPIEYVCLIVGWALACALMCWAKAYRDVGIARIEAMYGGGQHEDEAREEED